MKRIKNSTMRSFVALFLVTALFLGFSPVSAAILEVGSNQTYTTIQSAIDNATNDDVINVHGGTYKEDVIVNKSLTIQANTGDDVNLQATNTGFTVLTNGSQSIIDGFKITNSPTGTGIDISANNCTIINNLITGGSTGISLFSGLYPIISGNTIRDMVGTGSKAGIQISTTNLNGSTGLTITGNTLFNINSTNDTALGISAFAMTMNSTVDSILIFGNTISNIYGIKQATALSVEALALNGPLTTIEIMENTIGNVASQGVNCTSTAISVVAMGFKNDTGTYNNTTTADKLTISKNKITNINSEDENGTSKGISFTQLFTGNSSISQNDLSNFKSDMTAVGISSLCLDFTTFQSNITIDKNTISGLTATNTTSGIESISLGNTNILHNNINQLNSEKTKYLLDFGLANNVIKGNNLEGTGIGEGIAIKGNTTINYNRIVNFQHNIQNIAFGELIEFNYCISIDDYIREKLKSSNLTEEQKTEVIPLIHKSLDYMDTMFPSNTTAPYNWYGTNSDPGSDKFLKGNGTLEYSPWLVLNINADPSTINTGQSSTITTDVYQDSAGGDHSADAAMFFSGPQVTFTTNLGNVGSKSVVVQWANGLATAILRADEGVGIATLAAGDYQTVQTTVTILGAPATSTLVNAANTIGMQGTGTPINYLIMALLIVTSGLLVSKRR